MDENKKPAEKTGGEDFIEERNKETPPDSPRKKQGGIGLIAVLLSILLSLAFLGIGAVVNEDFRMVVLSYLPEKTSAEETLAKGYMNSDADKLEGKNGNYIFAKREITGFEPEEDIEDIYFGTVSLYSLEYRLLPKDAGKMQNLEGREIDAEGRVTQKLSEGNPHLIISRDSKPSLLGVVYDYDIEAAGSLKAAVSIFLEEETKEISVKTGKEYTSYINRELGFSLKIPNALWEHITVAPWDDTITKETTLVFEYSEGDSSFNLFFIECYEKSALRDKELLNRDDKKDRTILAETKKSFFCFSSQRDLSLNEEFSALTPYFDEIKAGFEAL